MSQPVGIIVKATLAEESYKRFLKAEAKNIAAFILKDKEDGDVNNFYLIKYNNKSQALYWFTYLYYGNAQWLRECPQFSVIKRLEGYFDPDSTGYVLGTTDSLSPVNIAEASFYWRIEYGKFVESSMNKEQSREVDKDAGAFFRASEKGRFFDQFDMGFPLVDKSIKTQLEKLLEDYRLKNVMANLDKATTEKPLRLFRGFGYDGERVW